MIFGQAPPLRKNSNYIHFDQEKKIKRFASPFDSSMPFVGTHQSAKTNRTRTQIDFAVGSSRKEFNPVRKKTLSEDLLFHNCFF